MNHSKTGDPLFYPGEVAIWHLEVGDPANGQECVVLGSMEWHDDLYELWPSVEEAPPGFYYPVRDFSGWLYAAPWELRKKGPPQVQKSVKSSLEVTA